MAAPDAAAVVLDDPPGVVDPLLLCEDEHAFAYAPCRAAVNGGDAREASLLVASDSLYLAPSDAAASPELPIVRVPLLAVTAVAALDDGADGLAVEVGERVLIRRNAPHEAAPGAAALRLELPAAAAAELLPLVEALRRLAAAAERGDKAARGVAAAERARLAAEHAAAARFDAACLAPDERLLADFPAERVTPLCAQPGRVALTTQAVRFQPACRPAGGAPAPPGAAWPLARLAAVERRLFRLDDAALELLLDAGIYDAAFFALPSRRARDALERALLAAPACPAAARAARRRRLAAATRAWAAGRLSNFDYLLRLNRAAGRSFCDLSQYPVFPWVLADYTSQELDLSNPASFRDLSKPVAALSPARAARGAERFAALAGAGAAAAPRPWQHGSHYSSPAAAAHWLLRAEPALQLRLQGGRFDAPDRQFACVAEAWRSALEVESDLKELLPQFYDPAVAPALLINATRAPLGATSAGAALGDAALPPWARGSPAEFAVRMAAALESAPASARLHRWIDLVFGVAARGRRAEVASNVYHYMTYDEVAAPLVAAERDAAARRGLLVQAAEFGRTPRRLFARPHPARRAGGAPPLGRRLLAACICVAPAPAAVAATGRGGAEETNAATSRAI
jgi:hypothetical protein